MLLTVPIETGDVRLDTYLARQLPQYSRAYLHTLIAEGFVTIAGQSVKPSSKTVIGQTVDLAVPDPEPSAMLPEKIPLDVAYEDEWLLVINKPQGMVVHPAVGHRTGTLVNALLDYCAGQLSDLNGVIRPGIVHRIDKDTSGLILVVKDNQVHAAVAEKIRHHEVRRTYQALVNGHVASDNGTIEAPIGRDPRNRQKMAVVASGKPSVTHFRVLKRYRAATLIEATLESGRTHQIRVHMAYIGNPIVGDPVYGSGRKNYNLNGQTLHACALEFEHPVTGKMLRVESPLPPYFQNLLEKLQ